MNKRSPFIWWVVSGLAVVLALSARLDIGLGGASRIPDNPLGLTDFDAILIGVVFSAFIVMSVLYLVSRQAGRLLRAVRALYPRDAVYRTNVFPETADQIKEIWQAPELKGNIAVALVLTTQECSLWRRPGRPAKVASMMSEEKIEYKLGTAKHYGRSYDALLVEVTVGPQKHTIPFPMMSDTRGGILLPKLANGDELAAIEATLQSL